MKTVYITGAAGFIGRHMVEALGRCTDVRVCCGTSASTPEELRQGLAGADFVFHLAGVNRPVRPEDFQSGNAGFTAEICRELEVLDRRPCLVFSSSIQAALDNPYGLSKRAAEKAVRRYSATTGAPAVIFRLKNVFGKWCRPNYNSVTATFCHNIARNLPITISDPGRELDLVYIDDVVAAFLDVLGHPPGPGVCENREVTKSFRASLGELAATIKSFRESRQTLVMPSLESEFTRDLYATYLSYLDGPDFAYSLGQKTDPRGVLAEFMKSAHFGQIFVSRTKPGITRGNHYHHTKTEKFLVVEGDALIRFRSITGREIIEHKVTGRDFRVVDIPPGYAHSIENVGAGEMVVLFWASEIFDPQRPDAYLRNVLGA
jgi:UDP-2-acetamido-2,6-beta-L-arabino-hexul-4-ose reductase